MNNDTSRFGKKIFIIALLIFSAVPTPSAPSQFALWNKLDLSILGGATILQGNLEDQFQASPQIEANLISSYYGNFLALGWIQYALLMGEAPKSQVHLGQGGAGLIYDLPKALNMPHPLKVCLPRPGIGFLLSLIRGEGHYENEMYLLSDNESEFGHFFSLNWKIPLKDRYSLALNSRWNMIWSEPKFTHLLSTGLGITWDL